MLFILFLQNTFVFDMWGLPDLNFSSKTSLCKTHNSKNVYVANLFAIVVAEFLLREQAEKTAVLFTEITAGFTDAEGLRLVGFLQRGQCLLEHIGIGWRRIAASQDSGGAME